VSFKYFNVKNGLTTGNISLHSANANVQANYFIGNISVTSLANLGDVGNVKITGGTNGYVLQTDGTGNLSWASQGGSIAGISNGTSNVNIPAVNGNINFSSAGNANVAVITGTGVNVSGTLNITGQTNLGAVGNVVITGGANGYVLSTDGAGALSWISAATAGSNIVIDTFTGNGVQTVFTLTTSPTSEDYTIINIDGVSQLHSAYTVAGANVTLSSAPVSGAAIEVMTFNLGSGGGGNGAAGYTYVEITANTSASANTKYIVNTNTSNITVTLPGSPSLGTEVGIIDGTGNASVHAITVGRNGGNIQGTASDMTVTTNRSAFTLVYYNAAQGWILTNV
jgi:hypothetical protein